MKFFIILLPQGEYEYDQSGHSNGAIANKKDQTNGFTLLYVILLLA